MHSLVVGTSLSVSYYPWLATTYYSYNKIFLLYLVIFYVSLEVNTHKKWQKDLVAEVVVDSGDKLEQAEVDNMPFSKYFLC